MKTDLLLEVSEPRERQMSHVEGVFHPDKNTSMTKYAIRWTLAVVQKITN